MYNCCLVNLKDMLMNGTVISGTMVESPHSFSTACNVATQIIAQVASNQYGGQSISLAHLVPFVDRSRQRIRAEVLAEAEMTDRALNEKQLNRIVEKRLKLEIERGVQTIQYQVITLMTTNGQAPFLSVFMYLGEVETEAEKHDLAMIIEEVLRQRYIGVKNEAGVWITPAFPKLLYVLEEDNIREGSEIMQHMNDACAKWKAENNIGFSIYGTPIESTTYKFARCLQKRFGKIPGVSDKAYITNSYHVKVTEEIDAFTKLKHESEFQALSSGGAISYVEVPNLQHNLEAVIAVIQFIYDNIMYAELNTKSDYCQVCGFDGEIQIVEDDGKLVWECPKCGNRDQSKLNVARRTCGYIGSSFWGQGRTWEIKERVLHLS